MGAPWPISKPPSTAPSLSSPSTRPATCAVPGERSSLSPLSPATSPSPSRRDPRYPPCARARGHRHGQRGRCFGPPAGRRTPHAMRRTIQTTRRPIPFRRPSSPSEPCPPQRASPSRRDSAACPRAALASHLAATPVHKGAFASISRPSRPSFRRPWPQHSVTVRHIGEPIYRLVPVSHGARRSICSRRELFSGRSRGHDASAVVSGEFRIVRYMASGCGWVGSISRGEFFSVDYMCATSVVL